MQIPRKVVTCWLDVSIKGKCTFCDKIVLSSSHSEYLKPAPEPLTTDVSAVVDVEGACPERYSGGWGEVKKAVDIMRKVIRYKQQWWPDLKTYEADAYTRQVIANDTGIVSIMESVSNIFWDHSKGSREIIKAHRQTAHTNPLDSFAATGFVPNFYDDNIEIAGVSIARIF